MTLQDLYPDFDSKKVYQNFLSDMEKSSQGEKTSLRWIVNNLPQEKTLRDGKIIQVLVIGGTICRSALVQKINNQPKVLHIKYVTKPVFPTKEIFLEFVSSVIEKDIDTVVINSGDTIAPILENGLIDGILVEPDKENKLEGLKGEKLGQEIMKYFFDIEKKNILVSIVNDTICLLLCGLTKYSSENLAAGIVGTGINTAIFLDGYTAINLESGGFGNFALSDAGKYVNDHAEGKGEFLFQKETSGAYLFMHFNYFLSKKNIVYPPISKTVELSELAEKNIPEVSDIAQNVLEYSASLFATQIAGITSFLQKDMTFLIEGSLFWLGRGYKRKVEEVTRALEPNFSVNFAKIAESDIVGGAKVLI